MQLKKKKTLRSILVVVKLLWEKECFFKSSNIAPNRLSIQSRSPLRGGGAKFYFFIHKFNELVAAPFQIFITMRQKFLEKKGQIFKLDFQGINKTEFKLCILFYIVISIIIIIYIIYLQPVKIGLKDLLLLNEIQKLNGS